jgi:pSer/pThr/pTyr-binding forkhead associated (FHA) protein
VMLDHWSVSRHHARLRIAGDDTTVEDLDSKNGTFVNGQRIESATAVLAGDEILFGRVRAIFKAVETDASTRTDSSVRRRLNDQMRRT